MSKRCFDALISFLNAAAYLWIYLIYPPLTFFIKYLTLKARKQSKTFSTLVQAAVFLLVFYIQVSQFTVKMNRMV